MADAPWWTNSVNAGFILKRLCGEGVQRALQRQKAPTGAPQMLLELFISSLRRLFYPCTNITLHHR